MENNTVIHAILALERNRYMQRV